LTQAPAPILHLEAIVKHYRGLRPFRVKALQVQAGERVVMSGFDVITAELFTNLINGATLPDEGEVQVLGTPTHAVASETEWLASLDRFGVVTARAVLLDGMTVAQNLALPLSIEIDPMSQALAAQARALGVEAGLSDTWFDRPVHEAEADVRMRIHLARSLALDPPLLLLEHPTAALPPDAREAYARQVADVAGRRGTTVVACSQDRVFAREVATRYLQLQPATGELVDIDV
jgi:ABC-type transporter Mla maintaining outer membrane lipid asymmetry ATPase subunit MlaF